METAPMEQCIEPAGTTAPELLPVGIRVVDGGMAFDLAADGKTRFVGRSQLSSR